MAAKWRLDTKKWIGHHTDKIQLDIALEFYLSLVYFTILLRAHLQPVSRCRFVFCLPTGRTQI